MEGLQDPMIHLSSRLHVQGHPGGLKSVTVGVFTPRKLVNAAKLGSVPLRLPALQQLAAPPWLPSAPRLTSLSAGQMIRQTERTSFGGPLSVLIVSLPQEAIHWEFHMRPQPPTPEGEVVF